ncbi:MAG: hypothetical protein E7589_00620 [Ruminococcaceae bacterium]|nr:hypothetical protein [Oscillospiraceae bacterium]
MIYGLFGYCKVSADSQNAPRLLNICMQNGYPYKDIITDECGNISLVFRRNVFARVYEKCLLCGVEISVIEKGGFPYFLYRYRYRAGLLVGTMAAAVMVFYFSGIIWDVRVSGNVNLTDTEVISTLAECGFGVGSPKTDFRADVLENRVLINDSRIAWISVNLKGTVAHVEIRESAKPNNSQNDAPANIVAARSGVIQRIELEDGNVLVAAGDRVNEGELLVSGLYDSNISGYRWTHARAKVYARCVREINIYIPKTFESRVYTAENEAEVEYSVNFFGKEIKFSKKCGNDEGNCDIIEKSRSLTLVKGISLPLSVNTVWHVPYTVETLTRSDSQMERLAYFELSQRLAEIPGGAELIKKTVSTSSDEGGFYLYCTVVCVEDIARTVEFEVTQ